MRGRVADHGADSEAARFEAQKLAFAPLMFQAARVLRDSGLLGRAYGAGANGVVAEDLARETKVPIYAVKLLLEAGYASGLLSYEEPRFIITKTGVYWEKDTLTRVNADFAHSVCYKAAFHLGDALRDGMPAGLKELGPFATVYEGLSRLEPDVQKAWFAFDHYYSDGVFDLCLDAVFAEPVASLVDIGGNTGRFSEECCVRDPNVKVTLVDLPGQTKMARERLASLVSAGRLDTHATDVRDHAASLPKGADVYWMSQFLDCFPESDIQTILSHVRAAMRPDSRVFILETYWNEQRYEAARFCVIATSLYFACVANGTSRMYHSADMKRLVQDAGLQVVSERHNLGLSHSLLELKSS